MKTGTKRKTVLKSLPKKLEWLIMAARLWEVVIRKSLRCLKLIVWNSGGVKRALSITGGGANLYGSFGKNLDFGKSLKNIYTIWLNIILLGIWPKNISKF